MKKKTIRKRRLSEETYNLNGSFLKWLKIRLPIYLKEAGDIVDLDFHRFAFDGRSCTQRELIVLMIEKLKDIDDHTLYDDDVCEQIEDILEIWKTVFFAMWW